MRRTGYRIRAHLSGMVPARFEGYGELVEDVGGSIKSLDTNLMEHAALPRR
jgi:hypothetical protein